MVQRFSWSRTAPSSEADARGYFVEQEQARLRGEELNFAVVEPADDDIVLGGGALMTLISSNPAPRSATG